MGEPVLNGRLYVPAPPCVTLSVQAARREANAAREGGFDTGLTRGGAAAQFEEL